MHQGLRWISTYYHFYFFDKQYLLSLTCTKLELSVKKGLILLLNGHACVFFSRLCVCDRFDVNLLIVRFMMLLHYT